MSFHYHSDHWRPYAFGSNHWYGVPVPSADFGGGGGSGGIQVFTLKPDRHPVGPPPEWAPEDPVQSPPRSRPKRRDGHAPPRPQRQARPGAKGSGHAQIKWIAMATTQGTVGFDGGVTVVIPPPPPPPSHIYLPFLPTPRPPRTVTRTVTAARPAPWAWVPILAWIGLALVALWLESRRRRYSRDRQQARGTRARRLAWQR